MATWIERSRSPEYNPAKLSQEIAVMSHDFNWLRDSLGETAFVDRIEKAMLGETVIVGGYLNTDLIAAKSIIANHLDVTSLSAISADLGEITSGIITGATVRTSPGSNRIQLTNSVLEAYEGNIKRVQLDYNSLDFYTPQGYSAGSIEGSRYTLDGDEIASVLSINNYGDEEEYIRLDAARGENDYNGAHISMCSQSWPDYKPSIGLRIMHNDIYSSSFSMGDGFISFSSDARVDLRTTINGYDIITKKTIRCGIAQISPTPNEPTSISIYLGNIFPSTPRVVATAHTSVPGETVVEVSYNNPTVDYVSIVLYRTTSATTSISWIAMSE